MTITNTAPPAILLFALFGAAPAAEYNFHGRKALVIDLCPHVKITDFNFINYTDRGPSYSSRHKFEYTWKNVGTQPVIAFEIITLKYDPFDQTMLGSRTVVGGHNSADFSPLRPGESSSDGTLGYGHTDVFTAIAYVRLVRLADGTVWRVDESRLKAELRKIAAGIKDHGPLVPERKERGEEKRT